MSKSDNQGEPAWSGVNGQAADERAIEPLISFLRGHDVELRRLAALALGQHAGDRAVEALSGAAASDWDPDVRRFAVEGLGRAGQEASVAPLVKALSDRAEAVRDAAEGALERVGPVAFPALLQALGGRSLTTRERAAAALGRISDPRAVRPLIELLRGPEHEFSYSLRRAVAAALGEMAVRRPLPELREALPVLRSLQAGDSAGGLYRRVIRQIEAATAGARHLPLPAPAPPPPHPARLPIPAGAAEAGEGGTMGPQRGAALRRVLRRWLTPRLTTGKE